MSKIVTLQAVAHLVEGSCRLGLDDLGPIFREVNRIWGHTDVQFEVESSSSITYSSLTGDYPETTDGVVHVYFAHWLRGIFGTETENGRWQRGSTTVKIRDHQEPGSPQLWRVTAHEIGHILLGSGHLASLPSNNLMKTHGHNGEALTGGQRAEAYSKALELEQQQLGGTT